jgi:tellurite resistance protein TerC
VALHELHGFVLILLGLDLGVFHREAREVKFREALAWCAVWVSLALAFNAGLYGYALWKFPRDARLAAVADFDPAAAAWQVALEFLAGYVVEYSLSVDNIFVFLLVLGYFGVPRAYQHRVLFYGILGALVFRAVFIMLGSVLMQFHWVVWLFGAFLIFTGVKMAVSSAETMKPERNLLIRVVRRFLPVTSGFRGQRFFVKQEGRVWATPLLIALLCLEASDIVFAVDSVPAIFALTREPFIVFSSNVFAILGLRSIVLHARRRGRTLPPAPLRARAGPRLRGPQDGLARRLVRREVPDHAVARHHRRHPDGRDPALARVSEARRGRAASAAADGDALVVAGVVRHPRRGVKRRMIGGGWGAPSRSSRY